MDTHMGKNIFLSVWSKRTGCAVWMRTLYLTLQEWRQTFSSMMILNNMSYPPNLHWWLAEIQHFSPSNQILGYYMKRAWSKLKRGWFFFFPNPQGCIYNVQNLRGGDEHEDTRGKQERFCIFNVIASLGEFISQSVYNQ